MPKRKASFSVDARRTRSSSKMDLDSPTVRDKAKQLWETKTTRNTMIRLWGWLTRRFETRLQEGTHHRDLLAEAEMKSVLQLLQRTDVGGIGGRRIGDDVDERIFKFDDQIIVGVSTWQTLRSTMLSSDMWIRNEFKLGSMLDISGTNDGVQSQEFYESWHNWFDVVSEQYRDAAISYGDTHGLWSGAVLTGDLLHIITEANAYPSNFFPYLIRAVQATGIGTQLLGSLDALAAACPPMMFRQNDTQRSSFRSIEVPAYVLAAQDKFDIDEHLTQYLDVNPTLRLEMAKADVYKHLIKKISRQQTEMAEYRVEGRKTKKEQQAPDKLRLISGSVGDQVPTTEGSVEARLRALEVGTQGGFDELKRKVQMLEDQHQTYLNLCVTTTRRIDHLDIKFAEQRKDHQLSESVALAVRKRILLRSLPDNGGVRERSRTDNTTEGNYAAHGSMPEYDCTTWDESKGIHCPFYDAVQAFYSLTPTQLQAVVGHFHEDQALIPFRVRELDQLLCRKFVDFHFYFVALRLDPPQKLMDYFLKVSGLDHTSFRDRTELIQYIPVDPRVFEQYTGRSVDDVIHINSQASIVVSDLMDRCLRANQRRNQYVDQLRTERSRTFQDPNNVSVRNLDALTITVQDLRASEAFSDPAHIPTMTAPERDIVRGAIQGLYNAYYLWHQDARRPHYQAFRRNWSPIDANWQRLVTIFPAMLIKKPPSWR